MRKSTKIKIWAYLMRLGNACGCHQIEDRSFWYKEWQFPVCSRCTGIFIGQFICVIMYILGLKFAYYIDFLFLLCMFVDWFIQYKGIKESTNIRRFITGNLAGIAQMSIFIKIVQYLYLSLF